MRKNILLLSLIFSLAFCFTVNAEVLAADTPIRLDKEAYFGFREQPQIVLSDEELNVKPDQIEVINVNVKSNSDPNGITVVLTEESEDSGVFRGSFNLNPAKSSHPRSELKIVNGDTITVTYKGRSASGAQTCTAVWKASTDMIEINRASYFGHHAVATVVVNDRSRNLDHAKVERTTIQIKSDADPKGLTVTLSETGTNTGLFYGSFKFSTTLSNSTGSTIKVNATSSITAAYTNLSGTYSANADFKFTEAVIATSAENDSGEGILFDIIVTEPDSNNPESRDSLTVKIGTGSSTEDMSFSLQETGVNTGVFKGTLYLTDRKTKEKKLLIDGMDKINIKYTDKTVPGGGSKDIVKTIKWEYVNNHITLDKKSYMGYNTSAKVTLYNLDLNRDNDKAESYTAEVLTRNSESMKINLKETKSNSGIFTGTIYFGESTKRSNNIIKMSGKDYITVTFTNPRKKSEITEVSADWTPQDGKLTLNKQEYSGFGAAVEITVEDWDAADDTSVKDEIYVNATVPGTSKKVSVKLTETKKNSGVFKGILYINGSSDQKPSIAMTAGETLEIAYTDKDTSTGKEEIRTARAVWKGIVQEPQNP
jgi:hypothetical protein